jgi:hypothetical protein
MHGLDWNIDLPLAFGNAGAPVLSLHRALAQEPLRADFETFIQHRFRKAHNADVRHFMPELFGLNDGAGILCAVAGVRPATSGALFLEHYLDEPIEHVFPAPEGPISNVDEDATNPPPI